MDASAGGRQSGRRRRIGKDGVDGLEDGAHRAKRERQRDALQRKPRQLSELGEARAHVGEHLRRRALEAVDRLLFIADGEHGPDAVALAAAGEELARQRLDQLPLNGARVLRFVDQDMVDAAIELVKDPLGLAGNRCAERSAEQVGGALYQILEVERGAARLGAGVAILHGVRQHEQRDRGIAQRQRAALLEQRDEGTLGADQLRFDVAVLGGECLVQQLGAGGSVLVRERSGECCDAQFSVIGATRGGEARSRLNVILAAGGEDSRAIAEHLVGEDAAHLASKPLLRDAVAEAEGLAIEAAHG